MTLTGDITPSYALLDAPTLGSIRNNFAERGIAVKPVFLMRDPIERFISSRRMKLRKQGLRDATAEAEALRLLGLEEVLGLPLLEHLRHVATRTTDCHQVQSGSKNGA